MPSVAQTELREPVPVAHPIQPRVLTSTHQIAGRLQLPRGHMDRLEQPAREQPGQLARVTAVGLDPVTRPLRHQPRRDHPTVDPALDQIPIETETGRARLVTAAHRRPAAQHPLDRLLVVGQRPLLQQLVGANRRQPNRPRVNVQPNSYRRRLDHGRRPPYVALPGQTPATHDRCVGADHSPPTTGHRDPRATAPSCLRRDKVLRLAGGPPADTPDRFRVGGDYDPAPRALGHRSRGARARKPS